MKDVIDRFAKGNFVIVVDDEDRENEGDLVIAAQHITPEKINFLLTHGKGLICVPLSKKRVEALGLRQMVEHGVKERCAFTITVDAKHGISTGISAFDRAQTIRMLSNGSLKGDDFVTPGHVFPLRAVDGGLQERRGHTEASIELCKLAGLNHAAVICEVLNKDGSVARMPQLKEFSELHDIPIVSIEEILQHQNGMVETLAER